MGLVVPGSAAPTNLHLAGNVSKKIVDSDLYDISGRIAEISPRLHIWELDDGTSHAFAINELCEDGVSRLVFRVKELDARVVQKLQYLFSKPLSERYAELERQEHKMQEEIEEETWERIWERLGEPMHYQLEKDGFINSRGKSYPKRGVKPGGN